LGPNRPALRVGRNWRWRGRRGSLGDQEANMVDLLHPVTSEPSTVFEREGGSIEIHELHPRETAVVRVEAPVDGLPKAIGEAIGEIEARMAEAGVAVDGPPFARYLSFDPQRIEAEIGCPVRRPAPHVGRVYPGRLPGGRTASILHIGPYETIAQTYERLQAWMADKGVAPSGPMWEVYWSDPQAEPDPATWRTEVLVPLG
jgi:effector-binding domain-containing protein